MDEIEVVTSVDFTNKTYTTKKFKFFTRIHTLGNIVKVPVGIEELKTTTFTEEDFINRLQ